MSISQFSGGFDSGSSNGDPWQIAQPANMAQIQDLQVQCEKDMMRVRIIFDRPFYGMVFSKGHYSNVNCVHVPSGLGKTQATFDIALQVKSSCHMLFEQAVRYCIFKEIGEKLGYNKLGY